MRVRVRVFKHTYIRTQAHLHICMQICSEWNVCTRAHTHTHTHTHTQLHMVTHMITIIHVIIITSPCDFYFTQTHTNHSFCLSLTSWPAEPFHRADSTARM